MASYSSEIRSGMETNTICKKENKNKEGIGKKPTKRKLQLKNSKNEQNNNIKRTKSDEDVKDNMMLVYQPWVIQTYGDLAKTKTVTLKKYGRILRTLRGEELSSADNSKFRFWVKAKGFCIGKPAGYEVKPADTIVGRYSVCDSDEGIPALAKELEGSAKDPPLYVPNVSAKNPNGDPVYRKVAVVENFFDIIYNVHVNLEGKPGKHAGQKRTYRTITETYAFLPREAVTRFLLGCTECQKRPRSTSPTSLLLTPSPSPTLNDSLQPQTITTHQDNLPVLLDNQNPVIKSSENQLELRENEYQASAENVNKLTFSKSISKTHSRGKPFCLSSCNEHNSKSFTEEPTKLWSPVRSIESEQNVLNPKNIFLSGTIDYTMPITTTYLKYMRSLGCKEDEALNFDNKHVSLIVNQFLHEVVTHYFH